MFTLLTYIMGKYNLESMEDYFLQWFTPTQLCCILRRVAMNMAISAIQAESSKHELCEDLEDLKTFIQHIERVKPFP